METPKPQRKWWQYRVSVILIVVVVFFLLLNLQFILIMMHLTPEAGRLWFDLFSSPGGGSGVDGLLYGLGGASLLGGGMYGAQKMKDWR